MTLRLAALCLVIGAAAQNIGDTEATSFTIHVVHHPNSPSSVLARDNLRIAFCKKFGVSPCESDASANEDSLHLVDNLVVSVPPSLFGNVSAFLQQHRIARLNPPATVDLDLAVHPNTKNGAQADYRLSVWAGASYPIDMNAVFRKGTSLGAAQAMTDEDMWAYTCSSDAQGGSYVDLCSKGPYAFNTTCRASPMGAHLHFYYRSNDADDTQSKATFQSLATKALGLTDPTVLCHDNYGHEEPHNATCWLGGPGKTTIDDNALFPPGGGGGSFVTSQFSIFVLPDDFARVVGWVLQNNVDEVLGKFLDYLLHPIFGCNFADHQMWSLHKGGTPNNLAGIEEEASWTGSSPPELDPMGPTAPGSTCACADPQASSYNLHLLYDPTNTSTVTAKDALVKQLASKFLDAKLIEDAPFSFKNSSSAFLAGQVNFKIDTVASAAVIADWLSGQRGSLDVLLAPNTCCGALVDYTQHALWAGNTWPLNTAALEIRGTSHTAITAASKDAEPQHDYLLYALYATANNWQTAAVESFLTKFASSFSLTRKSCTSSSAVEPSYTKLCMMDENTSPTATNPMTTGYGAVFVPKNNLADVLSWALTHRGADMSGYQVDLLMVPLTGAPSVDFNSNALHVGTAWQVNQPALKSTGTMHSILI